MCYIPAGLLLRPAVLALHAQTMHAVVLVHEA